MTNQDKRYYKKMRIVIILLLTAVLAMTAFFFHVAEVKRVEQAEGAYKVFIYDDGACTVNVPTIGIIDQTREDMKLPDGTQIKKGTLIIRGNGEEVGYDYTRRDAIEVKEE